VPTVRSADTDPTEAWEPADTAPQGVPVLVACMSAGRPAEVVLAWFDATPYDDGCEGWTLPDGRLLYQAGFGVPVRWHPWPLTR
jgi:hypothetical protein